MSIAIFLLSVELENDKAKLTIKLQNTSRSLQQKGNSDYFKKVNEDMNKRLDRLESPGMY